MKLFHDIISLNVNSFMFDNSELENYAFFDIETTGLHWKRSHLCVIGLLYYKHEHWQSTQILLESPLEEKEALLSFYQLLKNKKTLIHFNGSSFDIPYLIKKSEMYQIETPFHELEQIDLYRQCSVYKKLCHLESFKQKDCEKLVQYPRKDLLSGKELINIYQHYIQTHDQKALDLILLHNYDDLCGMTAILPLLNLNYYLKTPCNGFIKEESNFSLTIHNSISWNLPVSFFLKNEDLDVTFYDGTLKVTIQKNQMELKHYFTNYKDYYYLPFEDQAIHKSVGQFVDKEHRVRATAANCYQRKTGDFIFAPSGFTSVSLFSNEVKADKQYCLYNEEFHNPEVLGNYLIFSLRSFIE